jgi:hypothetical protein
MTRKLTVEEDDGKRERREKGQKDLCSSDI